MCQIVQTITVLVCTARVIDWQSLVAWCNSSILPTGAEVCGESSSPQCNDQKEKLLKALNWKK